MFRRKALIAALVFSLGCDSRPGPLEAPEAFMHAYVTRAFVVEHRGSAVFGGGTMAEDHFKLHISSYDRATDGRLGLQMLGMRSDWLELGEYTLEPRNFLFGDKDGNTATYGHGGDLFVAESGALTITYVSRDRIQGSFQMIAVFWCRPPVDPEPCYSLPAAFSPDAPRIEVSGTFSAERAGPVPTLPGN